MFRLTSFALDVRAHLLLVVGMAVALPGMHWVGVLCLFLPVLVYHLIRGAGALRALGRGIWRLKWLLVAIAGIYLWLPEASDVPIWVAPLERGLILVTLLSTVHTLTLRFGGRHLGAALGEWFRPLEFIGLPGQAFARRLARVVDNLSANGPTLASPPPMERGTWWTWVPRRLAAEIRAIEKAASRATPVDPAACVLGPTPGWQWLSVLVLLGGVFSLMILLP